MKPGYYWARFRNEDGTIDEEWEVVEVWDCSRENAVSQCGDDGLYREEDFEFGDKIERLNN